MEETSPSFMHEATPEDAAAGQRVLQWALARLADRRAGFPATPPATPLPPVSPEGIGVEAAIDLLLGAIMPSANPADDPRYLAFIPGASTLAAAIADMAVSASMIYGGSRIEAGAAADAEDAVIGWLAGCAGFPATAGGTFVSGGSIANLSALVAARGDRVPGSPQQVIVGGASAHSSLVAAAQIMGCSFVTAEAADEYGRLTASTLEAALHGRKTEDVVAVVATAGATNTGAVDDLPGVAAACRERGIWLHVDAAYGGGALLSERTRPLFAGIEQADSFIVDPHKWLYAPYDCAAVVYRDSAVACRALTQEADYLACVSVEGGQNPSDLAIHLTRRIRGVPLWVSLQAYGQRAYTAAVECCLDLTEYAAERVRADPALELALEPALSVVVFRRRGWEAPDYDGWSASAIARGLAFVTPTRQAGRPALRLCFVNPLTTSADIDVVLQDLA